MKNDNCRQVKEGKHRGDQSETKRRPACALGLRQCDHFVEDQFCCEPCYQRCKNVSPDHANDGPHSQPDWLARIPHSGDGEDPERQSPRECEAFPPPRETNKKQRRGYDPFNNPPSKPTISASYRHVNPSMY